MKGWDSEAFGHYVAPVLGKTTYGRVAAGAILSLAALMIVSTVVVVALVVWSLTEAGLEDPEAWTVGGRMLILLTLLSIPVLIPAVWAAARVLHGQPFATLLGAHGRFPLRDLGLGLVAGLVMSALSAAIAVLLFGPPERSSLAGATLAVWALPLLLLIAAQCFAEELFFRGYLVQHLRAISPRPLLFVGAPALLFALMHLNPELPRLAQGGYVVSTALFAVIATMLLIRTGSLAAPTGLHIGVNGVSLGIVGADDILAGTQAFVYPAGHATSLIAIDAGLMAIAFVALAVVLRRRPAPV